MFQQIFCYYSPIPVSDFPGDILIAVTRPFNTAVDLKGLLKLVSFRLFPAPYTYTTQIWNQYSVTSATSATFAAKTHIDAQGLLQPQVLLKGERSVLAGGCGRQPFFPDSLYGYRFSIDMMKGAKCQEVKRVIHHMLSLG